MRRRFTYFFFFLTLCLLAACARYGTPGGGIKDTDAPKIIQENSESNMQTRFNKKKFSFEFDEWIKVQNPIREVVISPPTDYPFKVSERGKRVTFEFAEEEVLKENATYQINFGDAIKDFTEGNTLKNFVFVFSTGDVIDSLSVGGNVVDVSTGEGMSDVVVMLYDNLSDTSFFTQKPFYFTKTNANGKFQLNNLKSDTFQIFALEDGNVNYYYDQASEKVGFLDSMIILKDTLNNDLTINVFDEEDEPILIDYEQDYKGLIKLAYAPTPFKFDIESEEIDSLKYFHEIINDSIYLWHNILNSDSSVFMVKYNEEIDTVINKKAKKSIRKRPLSLHRSIRSSLETSHLDSITLFFNKPILSINDTLISLKDTLKEFDLNNSFLENRMLVLHYGNLTDDAFFDLQLLPEALTDWYGMKNKDTINLKVKALDTEQLGNINLTFTNSDSINYIAALMLKNDKVKEFVVSTDSTFNLSKMKPAAYKLELIQDRNGDGRWSPGDIKTKRHSEKIKSLTLEELKAGWDLELSVDLKEIFDDSSSK